MRIWNPCGCLYDGMSRWRRYGVGVGHRCRCGCMVHGACTSVGMSDLLHVHFSCYRLHIVALHMVAGCTWLNWHMVAG